MTGTETPDAPADTQPTSTEPGAPKPEPRNWTPIYVLSGMVLLTIVAVAFALSGGDDGPKASAADDVSQEEAGDAEDAPDSSDDEAESEADEGAEAGTTKEIGQTGVDGGIAFKVHSVQQVPRFEVTYGDPIRPAAGAKLIAARVTIKNVGRLPSDPFCGASSAVLVDAEERNFQPHTDQIQITGNKICGEDLQPGFKRTETLAFEVPSDATGLVLAVWDGNDPDDSTGDGSYLLFPAGDKISIG